MDFLYNERGREGFVVSAPVGVGGDESAGNGELDEDDFDAVGLKGADGAADGGSQCFPVLSTYTAYAG